ncbi:MAG: hypothetical protein IT384_28225 [Deltaproteobacteria bacterium]|nr:hypothetical protein [Deltaproteobacteria bacterium]
MADSVVFVGWNRPKAGREKHANELFNSFLNYLGKQQQAGVVESFEPVLLNPHGGDMNGFVLVRGSRDKLNQLTGTDEWYNIITDCNVAVDNFGQVMGWTGTGVNKMMGIWQNTIKKY